MNRLIIVLIAVLFVLPVAAADDNAVKKAEVVKVISEFLTAEDQGSFQNHDRFWADDLIYTSSNGTRFDKRFIMDGIEAEAQKSTEDTNADAEDTASVTYTGEDFDIRIYGNVAVAAFRLVGKSKTKAGVTTLEYYNTGTLLKRNGVWKAVAWQATKIPDS